MNQENCPCCQNHCPKDNLRCGRGKEYFSNQDTNNKLKTLNEQVIANLRKCGHLLHHNRNLDTNEFLSCFSKEELNELHKLLSKIK